MAPSLVASIAAVTLLISIVVLLLVTNQQQTVHDDVTPSLQRTSGDSRPWIYTLNNTAVSSPQPFLELSIWDVVDGDGVPVPPDRVPFPSLTSRMIVSRPSSDRVTFTLSDQLTAENIMFMSGSFAMNMFGSGITADISTSAPLQLVFNPFAMRNGTLSGQIHNHGQQRDGTIILNSTVIIPVGQVVLLENWIINSTSSSSTDMIIVDDSRLIISNSILTCAPHPCRFSSRANLQLAGSSSIIYTPTCDHDDNSDNADDNDDDDRFTFSGSIILSSTTRLTIQRFTFNGEITGTGVIALPKPDAFANHIGGTIKGDDIDDIWIMIGGSSRDTINYFSGTLDNVRMLEAGDTSVVICSGSVWKEVDYSTKGDLGIHVVLTDAPHSWHATNVYISSYKIYITGGQSVFGGKSHFEVYYVVVASDAKIVFAPNSRFTTMAQIDRVTLQGELFISSGANVTIRGNLLCDGGATRVTFDTRVGRVRLLQILARTHSVFTWNFNPTLPNNGLPSDISVDYVQLANVTVIINIPTWLSSDDIPEGNFILISVDTTVGLFKTVVPRGAIVVIEGNLVYQSGPQPPRKSSSSSSSSSTGSIDPSLSSSSTGSSGNTSISSSTGVLPSSSSSSTGSIANGWTYLWKQNQPFSLSYLPFLNLSLYDISDEYGRMVPIERAVAPSLTSTIILLSSTISQINIMIDSPATIGFLTVRYGTFSIRIDTSLTIIDELLLSRDTNTRIFTTTSTSEIQSLNNGLSDVIIRSVIIRDDGIKVDGTLYSNIGDATAPQLTFGHCTPVILSPISSLQANLQWRQLSGSCLQGAPIVTLSNGLMANIDTLTPLKISIINNRPLSSPTFYGNITNGLPNYPADVSSITIASSLYIPSSRTALFTGWYITNTNNATILADGTFALDNSILTCEPKTCVFASNSTITLHDSSLIYQIDSMSDPKDCFIYDGTIIMSGESSIISGGSQLSSDIIGNHGGTIALKRGRHQISGSITGGSDGSSDRVLVTSDERADIELYATLDYVQLTGDGAFTVKPGARWNHVEYNRPFRALSIELDASGDFIVVNSKIVTGSVDLDGVATFGNGTFDVRTLDISDGAKFVIAPNTLFSTDAETRLSGELFISRGSNVRINNDISAYSSRTIISHITFDGYAHFTSGALLINNAPSMITWRFDLDDTNYGIADVYCDIAQLSKVTLRIITTATAYQIPENDFILMRGNSAGALKLTISSISVPRGTIFVTGKTLVWRSGKQPPQPSSSSSSSTGSVDPSSSSTGGQSNSTSSSTGSIDPSSTGSVEPSSSSSTGGINPSSSSSSSASSSSTGVGPSSSSTGSEHNSTSSTGSSWSSSSTGVEPSSSSSTGRVSHGWTYTLIEPRSLSVSFLNLSIWRITDEYGQVVPHDRAVIPSDTSEVDIKLTQQNDEVTFIIDQPLVIGFIRFVAGRIRLSVINGVSVTYSRLAFLGAAHIRMESLSLVNSLITWTYDPSDLVNNNGIAIVIVTNNVRIEASQLILEYPKWNVSGDIPEGNYTLLQTNNGVIDIGSSEIHVPYGCIFVIGRQLVYRSRTNCTDVSSSSTGGVNPSSSSSSTGSVEPSSSSSSSGDHHHGNSSSSESSSSSSSSTGASSSSSSTASHNDDSTASSSTLVVGIVIGCGISALFVGTCFGYRRYRTRRDGRSISTRQLRDVTTDDPNVGYTAMVDSPSLNTIGVIPAVDTPLNYDS